MNRSQIAKKIKMSPGHLSDILNGNKDVGKKTAKKFAMACKQDWTDFLKMNPREIEKSLAKQLSHSEAA